MTVLDLTGVSVGYSQAWTLESGETYCIVRGKTESRSIRLGPSEVKRIRPVAAAMANDLGIEYAMTIHTMLFSMNSPNRPVIDPTRPALIPSA